MGRHRRALPEGPRAVVQLESRLLEACLSTRALGELVVPPRATLLEHGESLPMLLVAPVGTAPALEADQALVHGLVPTLVVDPDAVVGAAAPIR